MYFCLKSCACLVIYNGMRFKDGKDDEGTITVFRFA